LDWRLQGGVDGDEGEEEEGRKRVKSKGDKRRAEKKMKRGSRETICSAVDNYSRKQWREPERERERGREGERERERDSETS